MEHKLYWLWLTTKSIAPNKITSLIEYFGSVEEVYFARNYNNVIGINKRITDLLLDKDLSTAEKVAERTAKLNQKILVYDGEGYPQILKNLPCPPYVFYLQGNLISIDDVLTIGIVGTRNATDYGLKVTDMLAKDLAKSGVVTVSGLARGIDTASALGTLAVGGVAVAVVGTGLDIVYPSENMALVREITKRGCMISEYPPGTPSLKKNFPERNRIIAGLSRGVLVTEAPERSGALITVNYALDCNRDIFAVPRNIFDKKVLGTNKLIRDGAKLVNCADDILCEYPYTERIVLQNVLPLAKTNNTILENDIKQTYFKEESEANDTVNDNKYIGLSETDMQIINLLKDKDMLVDEIATLCKTPVSQLNAKLFMLEVKGFVKKMPGNRYQLV